MKIVCELFASYTNQKRIFWTFLVSNRRFLLSFVNQLSVILDVMIMIAFD